MLATTCGSTRKLIVCAGRSTVPAPAMRTSGPLRWRSLVWALPCAILKLAPSEAKSVFSASPDCHPDKVAEPRLRTILATLMPRMAPSLNSKLAVPASAETIARWLAPLAVRIDGDGRLAFDALKGRHVVEEGIGVEIGKREAEGLHRNLAGRIHAQHAGADAAIELEVGQFELELAAGHRRSNIDGAGFDRAVAQAARH